MLSVLIEIHLCLACLSTEDVTFLVYFPGECRNLSAGEDDVTLPLQAAKVSCQKLPGRTTCSPATKGGAAEGSQQLNSYKKIKLQLFPINRSTRQRLEKVYL